MRFHPMTSLLLVALSAHATARSLPAQSSLLRKADHIRVRSINLEDEDFGDLEPLVEKIGAARIVVLGEATHSEGTTSQAKARLVRFLHQRMGFNVLAWEAGLVDAWYLNIAIRGDEEVGSAATHLMRGGWDESVFSRPVFRYARDSWSSVSPLLMAGFDTGRPPYGAEHVKRLLSTLGQRTPDLRLNDAEFAAVGRLVDRAYSYFGRNPPTVTDADRRRARGALQRLLRRLEEPTRELHASLSDRQLLMLRLALRSTLADDAIRQALVTHEPDAMLNFNRFRDSTMAVRLTSLADSLYPGRKIVVWAATSHFVRSSAEISSLDADARYGAYRLAGDYLGPLYGPQLYTIAFVAYGGETGDVFAPGDERGESRTGPLPMPNPASFEAAAHELGIPYLFVDLRSLPDDHPMRQPFVSHALGYIPNRADWANQLDAFFFIDEAKPEEHHPRAVPPEF